MTKRRASRHLRSTSPAGWPTSAGQHVDIRLTAQDGYQAERSYSIASAPTDQAQIDLTVERVHGRRGLAFLIDELILGDRFEVRGPIGGYFVWDAGAAGSAAADRRRVGDRAADGDHPPASARRSSAPCTLSVQLTYAGDRSTPPNSTARQHAATACASSTLSPAFSRQAGPATDAIDMAMISDVLEAAGRLAQAFVCGPTPLVESAAEGARRSGPCAGPGQDRAFWTERRLNTEMDRQDPTLDANAVAGMLMEIFGTEMTAVSPVAARTAATVAQVGSLRAYGLNGPGVVLRCSICTEIVLRLMRRPTAAPSRCALVPRTYGLSRLHAGRRSSSQGTCGSSLKSSMQPFEQK